MGQPEVTFEIDGVEYSLGERRATAGDLIALVGLDAATHDLIQLTGQSDHEKRLADTDSVQLTPGARFITIFTGPTPVV